MTTRSLIIAAAGTAGLALSVAWLGDTPNAQAQGRGAQAQTGAPRLPWGDPDLEGIWQPEAISTPLERPARFGNREFLNDEELKEAALAAPVNTDVSEEASTDARLADNRPRNAAETATARPHEKALLGQEYNAWWTAGPVRRRSVWNRTSLIVDPPDGRMPAYTAEALKRIEAREQARIGRGESDAPEDRNLLERCISVLLPGSGAASGPNAVRMIVQSPGYVTMMHDGLTFARIIPLDGRPRLDDRIRQWLGDSRGRWEGDTLVVETTNVNDKQDGGPIAPSHNELLPGTHQHHYFGSGSTARVIERYRRVGPERIEYSYTLIDPSVYTRPYTILRPLEQSNDFLMLENACHEGNYGMTSLLSGGRANEKDALVAAEAETATRREQLQELRKRNAARR